MTSAVRNHPDWALSDWWLIDLLHGVQGGQHLDLARCAALIGEHDLGAGAVAMAGVLHLLQTDLLLDFWSVRTID